MGAGCLCEILSDLTCRTASPRMRSTNRDCSTAIACCCTRTACRKRGTRKESSWTMNALGAGLASAGGAEAERFADSVLRQLRQGRGHAAFDDECHVRWRVL